MTAIRESIRQSYWSTAASVRDAVASGLAAGAFLLLCLFHGVDTNLVLFAYAIFALLLALVIIGPSQITSVLTSTPRALAFTLAWLVALVASYAFSLSKDSSFVPTLALAVPVVGFVLGRGLAQHARLLFGLISLIVFGFACWSTGSLLVNDDLAQRAMTDVNNYGTLLYLIVIPWIHWYLLGCWRGRVSPSYHAVNAIGLFVVFVALLGTGSRACFLVVGVAFAVWWGVALWRRLNPLPVLMCTSVAVMAYLVSSLLVDVSVLDEFSEVSLSAGIRARAALIGSAIEMLTLNPLTGIGVLVFPLLYRTHRTLDDPVTTGAFVHNDYLQFLVEGGLPLLALALVFLVVVIKRCLNSLFSKADSPNFPSLGLHLGICAAAFHALVNFTYYVPALGFLIGLMVAISSGSVGAPTVGRAERSRLGFGVVVATLVFGWSCFGFLTIDTLSVGVFGGQPGIPLAASYRSDPDRMLEFALTAQKINKNRGLPVLVEASLLQRRIDMADDPDELVERTLAAYQRAVQIDPWNGSAWLGMAQFVELHPQARERLADDVSPESLVLASLEIDPLFVPGIDWLVARYLRTDRTSEAYDLVRRNALPWLRLLGRENPEAAVNYFRFMESTAKRYGDEEVLATLELLRRGPA